MHAAPVWYQRHLSSSFMVPIAASQVGAKVRQLARLTAILVTLQKLRQSVSEPA
ncbi:hypothetical protein GGH91_006435, partial [Coemansia sp. RSA 2671]